MPLFILWLLKSSLQREQSIATKLRATGLEGKAVRREEPAESFQPIALHSDCREALSVAQERW